MFPDISCDDIFRLETPRLWLRWPRVGDAAAVAALPGARTVLSEAPDATARLLPAETERFILSARVATASGEALVLGATGKSKTRTLIGLIAAHARDRGELELRAAFAPTQAGRSLAGEALATLVDACFNLTEARALVAVPGPEAADDASMYDRLGFTAGGSAEAGLVRLERRLWARGRVQRLPDMPHQAGRHLSSSRPSGNSSDEPA